MCLILAAYHVIEDTDLLLVSNRDERYDRKATSAHFWNDRGGILGGRDQERGGTWLAVSRSGRLAAVTNIREPEKNDAHAPSRGVLPVEFVGQESAVDQFLDGQWDFDRYNGFNLVLWDGEHLAATSNRSDPVMMPPGIHGISNGPLSSSWAKVQAASENLTGLINSGDVSDEEILSIMRDQSPKADDRLPNTGVGLEMERVLSSAFIQTDGYGTRCTTIVRFRSDGLIMFDEFTYDESARIVDVSRFEIVND
ncbi:MAG: NRDE family protein [Rhodothermia bacterium]|nr:NRDE family protein [Rhodothermia bacterium]NNE34896.1 NRDE family protein [Rhodothermales bacterium]